MFIGIRKHVIWTEKGIAFECNPLIVVWIGWISEGSRGFRYLPDR